MPNVIIRSEPERTYLDVVIVLEHDPRRTKPFGSDYEVEYTSTRVVVYFPADAPPRAESSSARGRRVKKDGSLSDANNCRTLTRSSPSTPHGASCSTGPTSRPTSRPRRWQRTALRTRQRPSAARQAPHP